MHTPRRRSPPLAALAIALTLFALAAAFVVRRSLACPVEIPPQTLRTLYKHSDRIVVARVGHTEVVESDEESTHLRTALHVARNVKGKDEGPLVFVHHETWEGEGAEQPGAYKQGEQLLVFLERGEEEGREGYRVDNETYGVKKLSDDDLKVYLARIGELEQIEARRPPDKTALVEWLVRCAEEKATRWEGAYELQLSAEALARASEEKDRPADPARAAAVAELSVNKHNATVEEYEEAVARARAAAAASAARSPAPAPPSEINGGDSTPVPARRLTPDEEEIMRHTAGPGGREESAETRRATPRDPSLAAALGEGHKRRLADALFGAEKMGEGEDALLRVVRDFGDARLVPFLVAQLRRVEDDAPPVAEGWLSVLSEVMNNEEAAELVSKYSEDVTYYDYAIGEETTAGGETGGAEREVTHEEYQAQEAAAAERARKKRSAVLKDLLAKVERILAAPAVARR